MPGEISATITGNLTNNPEQRNVNGYTVVTFTIAQNSSYIDRNGQRKDGNTVFMRCNAWNQLGEHIIQSGLCKGMSVIATGTLRQSTYTDQTGMKHTMTELNITDCGPSLRYATADVRRAERRQSNNGYQNQNGYQHQGDQWNQPSANAFTGTPADQLI